MDTEKIKSVIEMFERSRISTLDLETGDMKIKLEKKQEGIIQTSAPTLEKKHSVMEPEDQDILHSPLVGTFYASSSPESAPYVEKGSLVKEGDTLCIVEAMKMMNEIKANRDGVVKDILVEDGDIVEYNQAIMVIGDRQ